MTMRCAKYRVDRTALSGNEVLSAYDGLEALWRWLKSMSTSRFLDPAMPGMDGEQPFGEGGEEGYEARLILSAYGAKSRTTFMPKLAAKPFAGRLAATSLKLLGVAWPRPPPDRDQRSRALETVSPS
jgi:hypothetical protein